MNFLTSSFGHESDSSGPLSIPLGPFRIFMQIHGGIRNFVFIASIIDTGDKLYTGSTR
jgi:hypothetical protein